MTRKQIKPRLVSPAFLKLLSVLEVNGGRVKTSNLVGRGSSLGKRETADKAAAVGLVGFEGDYLVLLEPGKIALTAERGK